MLGNTQILCKNGQGMLEAVNSVLQSAPLVRGNLEQASTAESFAANPERVQKVAQAPYVSPYVYVDVNFDKAILQLRDSETGDVVQSFPSDTTLESRARDAARQAEALAAAAKGGSSEQVRQSAPQAENTAVAHVARTAKTAPAATARQIAAFVSAAQTGASSSSGVSVFA